MKYVSAKLAPYTSAVFGVLSKYLLFPIYKILLTARLRLAKLTLSARGSLFLIFTNRYVFHAVIGIVSFIAIGGQINTKNVSAADVGNRSLLYALATQGQNELIEETPYVEPLVKINRHLGPATIEALPDIDFDYDDTELEPPLADLTIPGSIALLPEGEDFGVPGDAPVANRSTIETYVVQSGDTVASIAKQFGLNVGTIVWANSLNRNAAIKPGDSLKILPVSGILHTVKKGETIQKLAGLYKVEGGAINEQNRLQDRPLALNEQLIIPGASPLSVPVAVRRPSTTPTPSTRRTIALKPNIPISNISRKSYDVYQEVQAGESTDARTKPADLEDAAGTDTVRTKLLWPTRLRKINQYYGWNHTGVDIDGDYTDPIYASEDGVVEVAGWNSGGYGLMIFINHGNGYKTRYAHASKMFVSAGDQVKRGQVIAMVGTTGRSTGTHLHYEVYVNNARKNPLAYAK